MSRPNEKFKAEAVGYSLKWLGLGQKSKVKAETSLLFGSCRTWLFKNTFQLAYFSKCSAWMKWASYSSMKRPYAIRNSSTKLKNT